MKICTLMSGSSGNAVFIETSETKILIDAGQSGKAITCALEKSCGITPGDLDAIFLTHGHRDHIMGAGVLARRYKLPVYATEGTWCEIKSLVGNISEEQKKYIDVKKTWELGDIKIETFPLSHDAVEPVGFLVSKGGKSVGLATDTGVFTTRMGNTLQNSDCLILEANHDSELLRNGAYPWSLKKRISGIHGHLSNETAGQALLRTLGKKSKEVILSHLSEENNEPKLALKTVKNILETEQVSLEEVNIMVAPRYKPGVQVNIE
ncbi:MAG: MBL fold metallo-hydrolase [Clostridia bacterium]|nr:MBL fold metallo-hydrolase [Clostridia bacterium]